MWCAGKKSLPFLLTCLLFVSICLVSCYHKLEPWDNPADPDAENYQPPPIASLAEAVDNLTLSFYSDDLYTWSKTTSISNFGGDSARNGGSKIAMDSSSMWTSVSVSGASGDLTFDWKVSSQLGQDGLEFYIDGAYQIWISGSVGWQTKNYTINGSGSHTLKWKYSKDGDGKYGGSDYGWVDHVIWVP